MKTLLLLSSVAAERVRSGQWRGHTGKPIRLQTEALYQQDQYDVVLM